MKKRTKILTAIALTVLLAVGVFTTSALASANTEDAERTQIAETVERSGRHRRPNEAEEPENAIGKEAAKSIALSDAGVTADEVERLRSIVAECDGVTVYKVRFRCGGLRYSYRINALTGEIVNSYTENIEDIGTGHGHGSHGTRPSDGTQPEDGSGDTDGSGTSSGHGPHGTSHGSHGHHGKTDGDNSGNSENTDAVTSPTV